MKPKHKKIITKQKLALMKKSFSQINKAEGKAHRNSDKNAAKN